VNYRHDAGGRRIAKMTENGKPGGSKRGFFEKKPAKNFCSAGPEALALPPPPGPAEQKSFCFFFFRKRSA
jgi:hypothetical protein